MANAATHKTEKIPGLGWFYLVNLFVALFVSNFMTIGLGMLIPSIREDLNISLEVAATFSNITFLTQVIIALPVAAFATRVRPKVSVAFILLCLTAGCLLHAFAVNVAMIILGRVLLAVFAGSMGGPIQMVKSTWVPTPRMTYINGLQEVGSTLGQVIGTAGVTALITLLSTWRSVILALGIASAIITVIWLMLYKDNAERPVVLSSGESVIAPLLQALKRKEFWLLAIGWPGTTLVWIAFTTFWPTYATEVAGIDLASAGVAVGMIPIGSFIAVLASPPLTNWIGRDKLMIWPWGLLIPVFYLIAMSTTNVFILCVVFFLAGFGAFAFVPVAMGIPWKLDNITAPVIAMGTSFVLMIANIGGTLAGVVVSAFMDMYDLRTALMICTCSPLLWFATTIFLPELGRKYQEKKEAEQNGETGAR